MSELDRIPDPLPAQAAPVPVLGYVAEQAYVPTGQASFSGVLIAIGGGLLVAAVAAGIALLWMISRLPNFLVLPIAAQGLAVGGALAWLYRRHKVRNPAAAAVIGILCG